MVTTAVLTLSFGMYMGQRWVKTYPKGYPVYLELNTLHNKTKRPFNIVGGGVGKWLHVLWFRPTYFFILILTIVGYRKKTRIKCGT